MYSDSASLETALAFTIVQNTCISTAAQHPASIHECFVEIIRITCYALEDDQ